MRIGLQHLSSQSAVNSYSSKEFLFVGEKNRVLNLAHFQDCHLPLHKIISGGE